MPYSKFTLFSIALALLICLASPLATAQPIPQTPVVEILALDPPEQTILGMNDRLHIRISYQSKLPLRFQAIALRQGNELEVGMKSNPAYLHAAKNGEALAWVSFSNPTHIDEVQVKIMDIEWEEIGRVSAAIDLSWRGLLEGNPREPANWVKQLIRSERRNLEYVYDPIPDKEESLFDLIFLLTVGTTPAYVLLQIYMLRKYRGRWRELAAIPLISSVPMLVYALIGFGITTHQWLAFMFRCAPFGLAYLVVLWLIKWLRDGDSQPTSP